MAHRALTNVCLTILTVIVVFVVLQQAKGLAAPVLSALLLGIILTPLSELGDRLRIPPALSAFLTVLMAVLLIFVMVLLMEPYVTQAINQAPVIWNELRGTMDEFRRVLRGIEEMSEDMAAALEPAGPTGPVETASDADGQMTLPTITDALFYAPQFAAQFMIFSGTLYFFLMVRNDVYRWVTRRFDGLDEDGLRLAAQQVSRYVLTISGINFTFGVCVVIVMHFLGMPSPILWGMLAFALNFVLYLGPIVLVGMLTVTGIVVFDGPASFLPAAIYLGMNATEAQFVTPTLVGKSLSVNPLTVFLSLVFWLWLWGPIGGIIAIPLLIWGLTVFKGATDQTPIDLISSQPAAHLPKT